MTETEMRKGFIEQICDQHVSEWVEVTGIKVPRFLVTRDTFVRRMNEAGIHYSEEARIKAEGAPTEDAGDTHGQYHNEAAWYKEQQAGVSQVLGDAAKKNLNLAVIIPDIQTIRDGMKACGIDPSEVITLGSEVRVSFGEDDEEDLLVVPELETRENAGLTHCPIDTPLGKAVLGHKMGETVQYSVKQGQYDHNVRIRQLSVKILSVK